METGLLVGGRGVVEAALAAGAPTPVGGVAGFVRLSQSVRELARNRSAGRAPAAAPPGTWSATASGPARAPQEPADTPGAASSGVLARPRSQQPQPVTQPPAGCAGGPAAAQESWQASRTFRVDPNWNEEFFRNSPTTATWSGMDIEIFPPS
ncbi:MAG: hypothetical protein GY772_07080, partial [bacterium]|nr:hypothetical protein [bacterium]